MTQADDELALKYGMEPKHAMRLREFCQGIYKNKRLLIVVRWTNPAALRWHTEEGYEPKPVTLKEGNSDSTGVIVGKDGIVIVSDTGKRYFSDYDLQGVYELRDTSPPTYYRFFSGNWVSIDATTQKGQETIAKLNKREPIMNLTGTVEIGTVGLAQFVLAINGHVCRGEKKQMFQHGAQDGFLIAGRPVLNADENGYLVFEPEGSMHALADRGALQSYYRQHKITWAYQS